MLNPCRGVRGSAKNSRQQSGGTKKINLVMRRAASRRWRISTFGGTATIADTTEGENQMPTKVNLELIIVWACVGFFTGAGWAVATWLVGRILGLTHL
jgi:hypothetical protein